jgi:hypothetical protein
LHDSCRCYYYEAHNNLAAERSLNNPARTMQEDLKTGMQTLSSGTSVDINEIIIERLSVCPHFSSLKLLFGFM